MVISLGRGRGVRGHTLRPRLSLGVPDVCLPLTPPRPQHPHTSLSPRATATTSVSVTVYGCTLERNGRAKPSLPFAVVGVYTVGVKRNLPHVPTTYPHVLVTHAPRAKALTPPSTDKTKDTPVAALIAAVVAVPLPKLITCAGARRARHLRSCLLATLAARGRALESGQPWWQLQAL